MSFCTKCGNELPLDANFCINCGNPIANENTSTINTSQVLTPSPNPPTQLEANPSKRATKKIFLIVLISAVTILLVTILVIIFSSNLVAILSSNFESKNKLKVYDFYFSFNDEELIDYINDNLAEVYVDSDSIDLLSDNIKTFYEITYNGDSGYLCLEHDKRTKKVCAIALSHFDDEYAAFAIAALIGKEIDTQFFTDIEDVASDIVIDSTYVSEKMTLLGMDGLYILYPNGYLAELLTE